MFKLTLTNGIDTFQIAVMTGTGYGEDWKGHGYRVCKAIGCDHTSVPAGKQVWHDKEHTETLWSGCMNKSATGTYIGSE